MNWLVKVGAAQSGLIERSYFVRKAISKVCKVIIVSSIDIDEPICKPLEDREVQLIYLNGFAHPAGVAILIHRMPENSLNRKLSRVEVTRVVLNRSKPSTVE